jgi:hypothetical protein
MRAELFSSESVQGAVSSFDFSVDLRISGAGYTNDITYRVRYLAPGWVRVKSNFGMQLILGPDGYFSGDAWSQPDSIDPRDHRPLTSQVEVWLLACRCIHLFLTPDAFAPASNVSLVVRSEDLPTEVHDKGPYLRWISFGASGSAPKPVIEALRNDGFWLGLGSAGINTDTALPEIVITFGIDSDGLRKAVCIATFEFDNATIVQGRRIPNLIRLYQVKGIDGSAIIPQRSPWLILHPYDVNLDPPLSPTDFH